MTTNGKLRSIQKNYDLLTAHERFIAALDAEARGDEQELMTLVRTCPRRHYTASEWPYRQRLEAARRLGDLIVFDVLAKAAGGYMGMSLGAKNGTIQVQAQGEDMFFSAAATWQGFKLFCSDIGVNFDGFLVFNSFGLLKWGAKKVSGKSNQAANIFEMYLSLLEMAEPEQDEIESARAECHQFWNWATGPSCDYV